MIIATLGKQGNSVIGFPFPVGKTTILLRTGIRVKMGILIPPERNADTNMKNRKRFQLSGISLKTQLIFSFLSVTLLVLSVSMYYSYEQTLHIVEKKTHETMLAEFHQIETNILTLMREVDKLSKTFLHESKVLAFVDSERLSNADFLLLEHEITKDLIPKYFSYFEYLDSIYIFTENGMVVGGTAFQNQSSTVIGKEYPFYKMQLYENVKSLYPKVMWIGGYKTGDFMRLPVAPGVTDSNVITMMRGYKAPGEKDVAAVLVFNLNERYLHNIYGNLQRTPSGSISVVDDRGTVISSTLQDTIGGTYLFGEQLAGRDGFGSFPAVRGEDQEQVFYYRIPGEEWMLVNEVLTDQYRNDFNAIGRFSIAVFVLSVALIVAISSLWVNRIMRSLQQLIKGMKTVGSGQVGLTLPRASNKEIGHLIVQFNKMSTGIMELMKKQEEAEKEKRRLEIEALQGQINPHFLFNTLNTVKWMAAVAGARNIIDCITNLGNMLRPIYYQPSLTWTVAEEIRFVQNYVNIMKYRYGEEASFEFDVPDSYGSCRTLRFIIQPLIENTLVHGEMKNSIVRIRAAERDGDLVITVSDTKGGMPPGQVERLNRAFRSPGNRSAGEGIGLSNVNKRIRLHFGEKYGIEVESEQGVGTTVHMRIPMIRDSESVQKL